VDDSFQTLKQTNQEVQLSMILISDSTSAQRIAVNQAYLHVQIREEEPIDSANCKIEFQGYLDLNDNV
jgi:hypothetical protein